MGRPLVPRYVIMTSSVLPWTDLVATLAMIRGEAFEALEAAPSGWCEQADKALARLVAGLGRGEDVLGRRRQPPALAPVLRIVTPHTRGARS